MKPIQQCASEQASAAMEAETRYTELRDVVCKELQKIFEKRSALLSFEMRIYDNISKLNQELEAIDKNFEDK